MNVDLKNKLEQYIPNLKKLLGEGYNKLNWKDLNEKFDSMYILRKEKYDKGIKEKVCSIYDLITDSIKKQRLHPIVGYFDILLCNLQNLPKNTISKIVPTIKKFLQEYDYNFLNFLGELSVLNCILQKDKYKLNNVEFKLNTDPSLKNNKSADFSIIENGDYIHLVEIVNIHLHTDGYNNMDRKINGKLEEKLEDKLENLDKSKYTNFILVPVIWYENREDYDKLRTLYNEGKILTNVNIYEPFGFSIRYDVFTNEPFYIFSNISSGL